MTGKPPSTLDRLWDDIPTGPAPINTLLAAGHAAKRCNTRVRVASTVAAATVAIGGGFFAVQGIPGGLSDMIASSDGDLDVRVYDSVTRQAMKLFSEPVNGPAAIWNGDDRTVIYVSDFAYSSTCPPEGTATITDSGAVTLHLDVDSGGRGCTDEADSVTVVIDGLTTVPPELTVAALGKTTTIPVAPPSATGHCLQVRCSGSVRSSGGRRSTRIGPMALGS